ncbi:MAG TPA: UvrD-helicase domain-containing protein [Planctomycetota bacterium]|nr:UvrD-helicase domain-containing protein [Planctomycetota bacterium]
MKEGQNLASIVAGLNPEQRRAVTTTEGPVLVLAGAGSGKTRVITVRIAHLLASGVLPSAILAMTFTNKAAGEMRERVAALVGKERAGLLTVGTFHAFCLKLLKEHAPLLGYPKDFAICDASDQLGALKGALRELRVAETSIQPGALHSRISLEKNRLGTAQKFLGAAADDREELIGKAWQRYEDHLRRAKSMDFDDLLLNAVRLLREHDGVKQSLAQRFRYVMVDEYQDTNSPQYEIVKAIAGAHKNLCVVGDDDQSIYGWRGADVTKILSFEKDFRGATTVRLETNYRSTTQILGAANRVIENNPKRHGKVLRSAIGNGDPVMAVAMADDNVESERVVTEIFELVRRGRAKHADFAILFRTGTQPRLFEQQLRARAIPYVLVGGMSFFDRKEVRDVLAFLRLCRQPDDEVSLLRVVNTPPRGVGKTSIDRMLEFATENAISVPEALRRGSEIAKLDPRALEAVQAFQRLLATAMERAKAISLQALVLSIVDAVGYRAEVERLYPDAKTQTDRWAVVQSVADFARNHEQRTKEATLATFLDELAVNAEDRKDDDASKLRDVVTLMTLHAAKGLEFPRVYLVGVEEGILPHQRAVEEDTVEEERRLMYVGITRAQRNLTITHCAERSKYGTRVACSPSRFLFEIKGEAPPKEWRAARPAKELTPQQVRGERAKTTSVKKKRAVKGK